MMELRDVATGLRFPEGPIAMPDGSFVLVEIERQTLSRISPKGEVSVIATLGGSPNGAAIGPDGACYVCNSGGFSWHRDPKHGLRGGHQPPDYSGGRIERVDLKTGESRVLYGAPEHPLRGPNDLVFDKHGGFWFTDSGKVREHDRDHGAIYYAKIDGSSLKRVVYPVFQPQPNGIGLSPSEDRLYVAETTTTRVWSFEITGPGEVAAKPWPSPNGGTFLAGLPDYCLFDSLAMEASGNVCVATMISGGITVFAPDGSVVERVPMPDTLPTNICFGGPDLRTAYITLSGIGRLVAAQWPRPGLKLNFLNR